MSFQPSLHESFAVTFRVTVRPCVRADLHDLEWFGLFTPMRASILAAFQRFEQGENFMLVAEANHFPVGQVWIDLSKQRAESIGGLWALRVLPPLQNLGIGSRLIATAESLLCERGYATAEISAEKNNPNAQRLYERLGYHVIRDNVEEWDYTTPQGRVVHEAITEWIMRKPLATDQAQSK